MFTEHELIKKNILTKGFHVLHEPDCVSLIDPDKFKLLNTEERSRDNGIRDIKKELADRLTMVETIVKTAYIDPIWPSAVHHKFLIWEGVDNDNKGWHTDMFEGYDLFFLLYLDDTFPESGGAIQFKWKEDNKEFIETIQPTKGTLIMINNCRGFWHRAVSSTIRRRVASFDYTVGLNDD
jgi:hypothetical protein